MNKHIENATTKESATIHVKNLPDDALQHENNIDFFFYL